MVMKDDKEDILSLIHNFFEMTSCLKTSTCRQNDILFLYLEEQLNPFTRLVYSEVITAVDGSIIISLLCGRNQLLAAISLRCHILQYLNSCDCYICLSGCFNS